jgi:hypothetical protein
LKNIARAARGVNAYFLFFSGAGKFDSSSRKRVSARDEKILSKRIVDSARGPC